MEICIFIKDKKNYKGNFKILKVHFTKCLFCLKRAIKRYLHHPKTSYAKVDNIIFSLTKQILSMQNIVRLLHIVPTKPLNKMFWYTIVILKH